MKHIQYNKKAWAIELYRQFDDMFKRVLEGSFL